MKKKIAAGVLYVLMMSFTNAYCQVHRMDVWKQDYATEGLDNPRGLAITNVMAATALWPFYWTSKGFLFAMENPPHWGKCEKDASR